MKYRKGIQTEMLVIIVAVVIGLLVFGAYILFLNEEVQSGGAGATFGKMMCGFLNIITGGWAGGWCNFM
ncbi:MAG: hypothetical protein HY516_00625 [Candidatus Aenigmarchaeota archaeon]|nr:hypothetical protein [Candidatus Aenigmarchaeota archaeon]